MKDQLQVYWKEVFPNSPFTYTFLADQLVSKHKDDLQFSRVISAFSFVSIVISCFGLFALAQRKEKRSPSGERLERQPKA